MEKFKVVEEIFVVIVKYVMSKVINNIICFDFFFFENCLIVKMFLGKY